MSRAEDADLRNGIEAAVKNLGHRCLPCFKESSTALGNRPCALIRRGKEEQALCPPAAGLLSVKWLEKGKIERKSFPT